MFLSSLGCPRTLALDIHRLKCFSMKKKWGCLWRTDLSCRTSEVTEESQLLKATQAVGTLQLQMSNEEAIPRPSLWSSL